MKHAVVEKRSASRHVTQGRRAKHTAVLLLVREVPAQRPAQSKVVVMSIRIRGDGGVAGSADGCVSEIRELRKCPCLHRARMTACAVPLCRIVERGQTAQFPAAQRNLAPHPGIILAAVRVELPGTLLIGLQGHQYGLERRRLVVEHLVSESV